MELNDLFLKERIDPKEVLVFRHRPSEPALHKVLPWLAAEKPEIFNAYQQTQGEKLETSMKRARYAASFIARGSDEALFVGLYAIGQSKELRREEYWQVPSYKELRALGMQGLFHGSTRVSCLWFDLAITPFHTEWKGKLVVRWPGGTRSWWQRADKNTFAVAAILEESALVSVVPKWSSMVLSWHELANVPARWKSVLAQWRGIYYIFDTVAGKGYVGSAYGESNLLGRWLNYAASGHGGNSLLRSCDHRNFKFSILQRVSPDMNPIELIDLESSWKERLHTRSPYGLNEN